jgi:transcriptional regulator with XRE-family HTH domain
MMLAGAGVEHNVRWPEMVLSIALGTGSVATPSPYLTMEGQGNDAQFISRIGTSVGESYFSSQRIDVLPQRVDAESEESSPWTVSALRYISGLTAAQLGRLFGVSRRSINNWMAGNPMAAHHEARLSALQAALLAIPAATPEERRAALLDSSDGLSLFQQLVNEVPEGAVIQGNPLAARDQF